MKQNKGYLFLIILIVLLAIVLRFYRLGEIPAGIYIDEASQAFDAYSLLHTGKDQYGMNFPIYLRSFGSFQSPLYTYFSIPFVYLFGLSIFSIRFLSALSGGLLVVITWWAVYHFTKHKALAGISALLLALAPWSVLFSRAALEANFALLLFVSGFYFLVEALKKPRYLVFGSLLLAIATHAYHAERVVSVLFLVGYLGLFYSYWWQKKRLVLWSLVLFALLYFPHIVLGNSAGSNRRLMQLNYWSDDFFKNNGGKFVGMLFGKKIYIVREFLSQYLSYFSPKSLFFEPDPQTVRSIPELSVFYFWFVIPFFVGIKKFVSFYKDPLYKMLFLVIIISPIPAALTRDPFYTLRALPLWWALTIVISIGIYQLLKLIKHIRLRVLVGAVLLLLATFNLYINYFVLLRYERSNDYNFPIAELSQIMRTHANQTYVVDSPRLYGSYALLALYFKEDPQKIQAMWPKSLVENYYNDTSYADSYTIENVQIRPIVWEDDIYKSQILVGDPLSISEKQIQEHKLTKQFEVRDLNGVVRLVGFQTNPSEKCRVSVELGNADLRCIHLHL